MAELLRHTGFALLAWTSLAASAAAQSVDPGEEALMRIVAGSTGEDAGAEGLAPGGRVSVEDLLRAVERGVPESPGAERSELSRAEITRLVDALTPLGRSAVLPAARASAGPEVGAARRTAAILLLGRVGTSDDWDLLLELAAPRESSERVGGAIARAVETATGEILERDRARPERLARHLMTTRSELRPPLVRALASSGDRAGFEELARLLGYRTELDPVLLESLAASAPAVEGRVSAVSGDAIRTYLGHGEDALVRDAVTALGGIRDEASIDALIALVGSESEPLAAAAARSLGAITGLALPPSQERWRSWWAREQTWTRENAPALFEALQDPDPGRVLNALNQLHGHRVPRATLAYEVARVLEREEPTLRSRACRVLGALGGPAEVSLLLEHVEEDDVRVASAAHEALETIAGVPLPEATEECATALEKRRLLPH